jgi:hypothetical protein
MSYGLSYSLVMALVSQTEFARLAGVSQPAISKAITAGLLTVSGKKVDTNGPSTVEYLRRRGSIEAGHETAPNSSPTGVTRKRNTPASPPKPQGRKMVTDEIDEYLDDEDDSRSMPVLRKGTKAYVDYQLTQQRAFALSLKNMEVVGKIFSREIFDKYFWNPWESMSQQWQTDLPRTIAAMIFPMVTSGSTQHDIEVTIRKLLSQTIKGCKARMIRGLDSLITIEEEKYKK